MPTVTFIRRVMIKRMLIRKDLAEPHHFRLSGPPKITVKLTPKLDDDPGAKFHNEIICDAWLEREMSDRHYEELTRPEMMEKKLPPQGTATGFNVISTGFVGQSLIAPSAMSAGFDSMVENVTHDLENATVHVVSTLRWRHQLCADHQTSHSTSELFWSTDKQSWRNVPRKIFWEVETERDIRLDDGLKKEVAQLVDLGESEPVAHMMMREAWASRRTNPRSALVIGVAALESGIKGCITRLSPETIWLMENMPSPPIVNLLTQFIPTLTLKNSIGGESFEVPKPVLDSIRNGVHQRNRLIHAGVYTWSYESLRSMLTSVHDLLRLFDYYVGYSWSLKHTSPAFQDALRAADSSLDLKDDTHAGGFAVNGITTPDQPR